MQLATWVALVVAGTAMVSIGEGRPVVVLVGLFLVFAGGVLAGESARKE